MADSQAVTFEEVWGLYNRVKRELKLDKVPNDGGSPKLYNSLYSLLQRRFLKEGSPVLLDEHSYFKRQESFEESPEREEQGNQLHFWERYYDAAYYSFQTNVLPEYLKVQLKLGFPMPKATKDGSTPDCEAFEALSDEQKREEKANLLKALAITSIRKANVCNGFKDINDTVYTKMMDQKLVLMADFLYYATLYNEMVPQKDQLLFSIQQDLQSKSRKNDEYAKSLNSTETVDVPVLDAHLPGYTRVSLHFGSRVNLKKCLESANKQLNAPAFEVFDIEKVYKTFEKNITETFNADQVGIVRGNLSKEASAYITIMEQTKDDLECFANLICPHLNGRDLFYLADMAGLGAGYYLGFGKGKHVGLKKIERERRPLSERERQESYIQTFLSDEKNQNEDALKDLYKKYLFSAKIRDDFADFGEFMQMVEKTGIDGAYLTQFCSQRITREIEKNNKEGEILTYFFDENDPTRLDTGKFKAIFPHLDNMTKMRLVLNLTKERRLSISDKTILEAEKDDGKRRELEQSRKDFLSLVEECETENGEELSLMLEPIMMIQDTSVTSKKSELSNEHRQALLESYEWYQPLAEAFGFSVSFDDYMNLLQNEIDLAEARIVKETSQTYDQLKKITREVLQKEGGLHQIEAVDQESGKDDKNGPEEGQPG